MSVSSVLPMPRESSPSKHTTASQVAPRRRTQAERRERAEQRLLEAALEIVGRRGSARMTLADVGEAAGYSRGLPAIRFGSKAGLLRALAAYIGERFAQRRRVAQQPAAGLDAIRGNLSFYFSRKEHGWHATRALLVMMTEGFMEQSELREAMVDYNRSAIDWYVEQIAIGIEKGEIFEDADPRATAVLLLATMRGSMMQWLVDPALDLIEIRDRLLAIVDRFLAKEPPSPPPIRRSASRTAPGSGASTITMRAAGVATSVAPGTRRTATSPKGKR